MSLDPVEFIKSEEGQEFLLKELKRKGVTAPDDREDIRSAFTLKLLESSAEFRGESSVKVFLSRSLNNAIIDFRRRRYGSQLGRNIKIPQSVHGQGETAVLVYQLLYNKGQRSLREAWEAYQNEKPENPLSWNAFQILVARLPEAKDRLRHFDDINDTQIPMVAADPTHAIHHRTLLRAALAELTPNERMALVIKTEDGLDADSCKKIFGMAIGWEACRKRVQRIMDRVKAVLESRGFIYDVPFQALSPSKTMAGQQGPGGVPMNNKQKWTEQELLAAELELMANEANQAPLSDQQMTAFLEGQLPPAERDQAMEQILNSPISLSILKTSLTLPDLPEKESIRGRVLPFRKWLPQLTVIAAVLLMALGLFFFPPTDQPINQGTITLTAELRYLLINHESTQFQDRDSLQLWAKNLKAAGFNIQELKKVELDQEYLSTKGPIAPLEEVVFHFQDGVLYISIRQKEEK